jgi:hypothetical protein
MESIIFKYNVDLTQAPRDDIYLIDMPRGAALLSCAEQHGKIAIWAKIPVNKKMGTGDCMRRVMVVCSGAEFEDNPQATYLGTAQLKQGMMVVHIFDLGEVV